MAASDDPTDHPTGTADDVTVVTVAHGDHEGLDHLHRSLSEGSRRPAQLVVVALDDEELITWQPDRELPVKVIPMSTTPGGLPWAAAKNAGATAAFTDGARVVVFVHHTALADAGLVEAFENAAASVDDALMWAEPVSERGRQVESAGASPEQLEAPAFALTLGTWGRVKGFCEDYVGDGFEDLDLARAAHDAGIRIGPAQGAWFDVRDGAVPVAEPETRERNAALHQARWGSHPSESSYAAPAET